MGNNEKIAIAATLSLGLCQQKGVATKKVEEVKPQKDIYFKIDNFYKPTKISIYEHRGKHRKSKYPYIK